MSATVQPGPTTPGAYGPAPWVQPPGAWNRGWNPWAFVWTVPKPWLIAATVLAFVLFWPLGIAVLFFMIGTGRIGSRWGRRHGQTADGAARGGGGGCGWNGRNRGEAPSSGNRAFDEYREDTLRRLEEEQREFSAFLERLRFAKDKAEFDQFMAERRQQQRPSAPPPPPQDAAPQG